MMNVICNTITNYDNLIVHNTQLYNCIYMIPLIIIFRWGAKEFVEFNIAINLSRWVGIIYNYTVYYWLGNSRHKYFSFKKEIYMFQPNCLKIQVLSETTKRIFACLSTSFVLRVVTGRKKEKHTVILCSVRTMILPSDAFLYYFLVSKIWRKQMELTKITMLNMVK